MTVDGSTLGERQEPVRIRRDIGREGTRRATTHRIRVPMRPSATAFTVGWFVTTSTAKMAGDE